MKLILSVKNGQYYLEKVLKIKEGIRTIRTNNQDKIFDTIKSIDTTASVVSYYGKDVKLYFGNHMYLILKNYMKYGVFELYDVALDYIDENTAIVENIFYKNKMRLKKILLSGTLAISTALTISRIHTTAHNQDIVKVEKIDNVVDDIFNDVEIVEPMIVDLAIQLGQKEEIISTKIENETEYNTFSERIEQTKNMKQNSPIFAGIELASKFDKYYSNKISNYSDKKEWQYINFYSSQFGVDPYLILATCYAETNLEHEKTLPGGSRYNGHAVGIGQHENPTGKQSVTAFNYETGQFETEIISLENACDLEMNIKMTVMLFQNRLQKYNNNIYATIQSYNYGNGAMDLILKKYAQDNNCLVEDVLTNYSDIGWLEYVKDFHNNPKNYLPKWKYKTYGNGNYIKDVLGYYLGVESINTLEDGTKISVNLITLDVMENVKVVDNIR